MPFTIYFQVQNNLVWSFSLINVSKHIGNNFAGYFSPHSFNQLPVKVEAPFSMISANNRAIHWPRCSIFWRSDGLWRVPRPLFGGLGRMRAGVI